MTSPAHRIAALLDGEFDDSDGVWVTAKSYYDQRRMTERIVLTLDPDVGFTERYVLTLEEA